jgi:hypothetical protein
MFIMADHAKDDPEWKEQSTFRFPFRPQAVEGTVWLCGYFLIQKFRKMANRCLGVLPSPES